MLYVLDDDNMLRFVDSVQHAPLSAEPGAVESGQRVSERLADAVRSREERPGEEFDSGGGNVFREQFGYRAPRGAGHSEFVRVGTHRLRSASSARAASVP
jgi:hypothetical protein